MNTVTQITRRQAIIEFSLKKGTTAAARRYNVSRQLIYRWKKRYDRTLESLKDRSHRPYSHPNQHTDAELLQSGRPADFRPLRSIQNPSLSSSR